MKDFKKPIALLISVSLILGLFLTGCNKGTEEKQSTTTTGSQAQTATESNETFEPLGKYEPAITLTAIRIFDSEKTKFVGEDDLENNIWTRGWEEDLGIKIQYDWYLPEGQEFMTKLNLIVATNDLPDILQFPDVHIFRAAARSGQLAALDELAANYGISEMADIINANNGIGKKYASYDGILYGIPVQPEPERSVTDLWLREDWLQNMGMKVPETFDEMMNMFVAMAKNDPNQSGKADTYGFAMGSTLLSGPATAKGFFNACDAYPDIWITKNGKLEYGGVQPEVKVALEKLIELNVSGAIDPEFAVLDIWGDLAVKMGQGIYGAFLGPDWVPYWPLNQTVEADINAEWVPYLPPALNGRKTLYQADAKPSAIAAVSAKSKNPEALIKLCNYFYEKKKRDVNVSPTDEPNPFNAQYLIHADGSKELVESWQYSFIHMFEPHQIIDASRDIKKIFDANGDRNIPGMGADRYVEYDDIMKWEKDRDVLYFPAAGLNGPKGSMRLAVEVLDNNLFKYNAYFGPNTETMEEMMGSLESKMNEYFIKAIINKDIKVFDEWVEFWNNNGGKAITDEVNEWISQNQ